MDIFIEEPHDVRALFFSENKIDLARSKIDFTLQMSAFYAIPQHQIPDTPCTVSWSQIVQTRNDFVLRNYYAPLEIAPNIWAHFNGESLLEFDSYGNLTELIEASIEYEIFTPVRGYLRSGKLVAPGAPKKRRLSRYLRSNTKVPKAPNFDKSTKKSRIK